MRYIKGIVSKDAEMKYDKSLNDYVMTFTLVRQKCDKNVFYSVEFVGRTAKQIVNYVTKGRPLRVKGECNYLNVNNQPIIKINVTEIKFIRHI